MVIRELKLQNFRCFVDQKFPWHDKFNLIVGKNATGKTTILDGLAVAMGSWLLGIRGYDSRHIQSDDVRLEAVEGAAGYSFLPRYPVRVSAKGVVHGQPIEWARTLGGRKGRTTTVHANRLKKLAEEAVNSRTPKTIPVLSYYGTGRLWLEPKQSKRVTDANKLADKKARDPLVAYRNSVDPRLSSRQLVEWIATQSWIEYQQGHEQSIFQIVRSAILRCIEGAKHLYFDPKYGEVIVDIEGHGRHPFSQLSDGQRCMLALVGDIAQRAVRLNGHLGDDVLRQSPGVVLIDELEMHLHPSWQRSIARGLKETFPSIQFFATTHSPQIIGQLPKDEVLILESEGSYRKPSYSFGLTSDEVLESVQSALPRDEQVREVEQEFLNALDGFDVDQASQLLDQLITLVDAPSPSLSRWETLLHSTRALLAADELQDEAGSEQGRSS